MNVLVACEFSGIVRDAFIRKGHNAISCDLLPSESDFGKHFIGDVKDIINQQEWDLMIAHPPCTYLCASGARWFKNNWDRHIKRAEAIDFVLFLAEQKIPKIAIENPIGNLSTFWRKPDQIIQPWQFGHGETKATCLWLKGLQNLKPTNIVDGRNNRIHKMPPSKERWKERSRTYTGIAEAMAEQWGSYA